MPTSPSSAQSGNLFSQTPSETPLVEWDPTNKKNKKNGKLGSKEGGPWGVQASPPPLSAAAEVVEDSPSPVKGRRMSTEGSPVGHTRRSSLERRDSIVAMTPKNAFEGVEVGVIGVGNHVTDRRRAANAIANLKNMEEMFAATVAQKNEHLSSLQEELTLFRQTAKMDKDSEVFRLQEELCNAISFKEGANNKITAMEAEKKLIRASAESERRKYQVELDKKDEKIDHLTRNLQEKDKKIRELNSKLEKSEKSNGNTKDEDMKKLQEQLTLKNTEISKLKLQLHDKAQKLKGLKEIETEKDTFKKKLDEKEDKIFHLSSNLRDTERKMREAESVILDTAVAPRPRAESVERGAAPSAIPVPRGSLIGTISESKVDSTNRGRKSVQNFKTPNSKAVITSSKTPKTPRTPGDMRKQATLAVKDLKKLTIGLGSLALLNLGLSSLEGVGVHDEIVDLYIQNNRLTSFKYLGVQPNMKELNASDNQITSFAGMEIQPKLEKLYMKGNPVCDQPMFRVMAVMACGQSLRKINDEVVSTFERQKAQSFGAQTAADVRRGLLLGTKCVLDGEYFVPVEDQAEAAGGSAGDRSPSTPGPESAETPEAANGEM